MSFYKKMVAPVILFNFNFMCVCLLSIFFLAPISPWAYILLWPSTTYGLVLFAYITNRPGILGKNKKKMGALYTPIIVLLFPYFIIMWITRYINIKLTREPLYTLIFDRFYLGGFSTNLETVPGIRVAMVVDFTAEFWETKQIIENCNYQSYPMLDGHTPNDMEKYYDLLKKVVLWKGPVFVHCAYGHSRSGAFMAALMVIKGQVETLEEAECMLKNLRPTVSLHSNQKRSAMKAICMWKHDTH